MIRSELTMKRFLLTPIFLFFLGVNPAFIGGCGTVDDDFTYGEAEMLDRLETISEQTFTHTHESDAYTIEVQVVQGDTLEVTRTPHRFLSAAWACTERSFIRDASACFDQSQLALEGTVTVIDETGTTIIDAEPVMGSMAVIGLHLNNARVSLRAEGLDLQLKSDDGVSFQLEQIRW